jgi:hypothetical protein
VGFVDGLIVSCPSCRILGEVNDAVRCGSLSVDDKVGDEGFVTGAEVDTDVSLPCISVLCRELIDNDLVRGDELRDSSGEIGPGLVTRFPRPSPPS